MEARMADFVDLKNGAFACRIGSNAEHEGHRAGYNGVWSLVPAGLRESLFVPGIAGLNLEHYFDGWHNGKREIFFEPRVAPMELETAGEGQVLLRQAPTPFWGVESVSTFTVREPNLLDLEFRCTPRRPVFNERTMGVFWASYIQRPEDNAIHFRGRKPGGEPEWLRFSSPKHGQESSVRGRRDDVTLRIGADMGDRLFSTVTPLRWEQPYYYGRWRDRVYLVLFRTRERLRFAMSPSGGGQGNPAWDFQILVPRVEVGREYRLSVRCIVDRWQGEAWVEEQARAWR
jgi:hypothetical protein